MEKLLPEDITLDIFSRLPIESVLECNRVCKTWRNVVYSFDNHFAYKLLHRQLEGLVDNQSNTFSTATKVDLGIVFAIKYHDDSDDNNVVTSLVYDKINIDGEQQYSYKRNLRRIDYLPMKNRYITDILFCSCNGLICISSKAGNEDYVYIFNPITREYVDLPKSGEEISNSYRVTGFGFGYHPSTNDYKVVRIIYQYPIVKPYVGHIQVYTLGDGRGWRDGGVINYFLGNTILRFSYPGVLVNGALHWLDFVERKIMAFDLADEKFCMLPSPPCFHPIDGNSFKLQDFGSCLYVVDPTYRRRLDLWSFKKTESTTSNNVKERKYRQSLKRSVEFCWSKEFSIIVTNSHDHELLAITKSVVFLLCKSSATVYRYDPTSKTSEIFRYNTTITHIDQITPHMNSFVSLKALGETDVVHKQVIDQLTE